LEHNFGFYAAAALATALTMRAKGPDISFVPLAVLAGFIIASGDTYAGVAAAIGVCLLIGVLNGIIVTMTNIPAVITTLVTGVLANLAPRLIFGGITRAAIPVVHDLYPLPIIALAICVLLVFLTRLKLSGGRRPGSLSVLYIACYAASAAIACVSGYYLTAQVGEATLNMGSDMYAVIALVFFSVSSVWLRHSKWSVVYALVPALAWALLNNAVAWQMESYYITLLHAAIILAFSVVFFITRTGHKASKLQML
jgi:ribose/xylose/arabinose/galactoside ABC-type transport system permease subunit